MNAETQGRHLKIDAICTNVELLNNGPELENMLHQLIDLVGMKVLVPANMVEVELDESKATSDGGDDGGITGVAVLSTSHISIHTWPLTTRFAFDLYSCCEFDAHSVFNYLQEMFGITDATVDSVARYTPVSSTGITWKRDD